MIFFLQSNLLWMLTATLQEVFDVIDDNDIVVVLAID